ncbi:aspartate carbamoyltransferase [Candidatus Giovannonibacteria bacterium RIFCSPLOWO2_02_FULL_43_11b]|uniref:Aspartate carbamoyltransferase n=1 Tax=Candidatus Nomurabacteria bacterium RIFCSPLOWO2_12_FULL_46_14 TaxID=1801797 RepID=A0A1F6YD37_9BACT|nr:MAG: aspartate carbamoyltransferase [Candidatus Giovannonibacteria bacterium RIFCSPHIGHO2_01_FULL_43_100]OGF66638.1 MAG: aspartate carbamoyltransferase [Candidatus Giovannonibacteria bacterium RIFCSPHIGHO2_02_FULL_43_32]OGF78633.1 MAG: aspartate carbamoyltransferase [Candidatus Giovannonibacteria bacterium RIFCSPLOWO2_01_FULL_43_60]OGF90104.1 MAG: aspartate carbamoyltransferase [Candidatus Giovannonibacteria bacterium RIFCSPLOWO2_02_FULL_43_11b]OGJ04272.1 MAG: aspartate carbamoyltransferase 
MVHILNGEQFADENILEKIFKRARELEEADAEGQAPKLLSGKIVATVFYETSTRTRLSFESGALKLGGGVISVADPKTSSASKGESLEDAIKVIGGYSDIIVLRHPENGAAARAADVSRVPVINAGDGSNEHPTQALYDLYSIQKELGKIDGLKIAFMSDLRYQRNAHSLIPLFCLFKNLEIYFIGPTELALPQVYKDRLAAAGIKFKELPQIDSILPEIDVLYVGRVFKERFQDEAEYEKLKKSFFVDQNTLARMKKDSLILHVMPRVFEIDPKVDADPRAGYFRQAKNGLYVRMALLLYALDLY